MSLPSQDELRAEERLLNEPLYQDLRPRIVSFIERLQCAATPKEWVDVHRELLIEFGARQDASDETLPRAKGEVATSIAELAKQTPKRIDQLRAKQEVLDRIKRQELVAKASQHTLRQIGDGMAWRALAYDRRAITILGEGTRVGRLAQGIGRDAELLELARLWEEEGVFAIHNDVTNCLRHGDLTAIRESSTARDVTMMEIKAGPRAEKTPQLERLERATEFLREGRQVQDGVLVHVTEVPGSYGTYLELLPSLIATARDTGFAWARPHDCLLLGAVAYRVWGRDADAYLESSNEAREQMGWSADEPETLAWTSSMRRIRDRGWSFSSLAPYTIFPLPPEDVADVVMGPIDLLCSLHLRKLETALARDSVEIEVKRAGQGSKIFLEAHRRGVGLRVPSHLREQMMVELMTPDSLFELLDRVLTLNEEHQEHAGDRRVVVFANEAETWDG
jgi:hypothetical protein